MNNFKYIYENEQGVTCFDKYFSYLQKILPEIPVPLCNFACDIARYELNGKYTLHDSWIESCAILKNYMDNGNVDTSIDIVLLLQDGNNRLKLSYKNVMKFGCSLEPDFWLLKPVDLLAHEFTKNSFAGFSHLIKFDRGVWIKIEFLEFYFYEI